MSSQTKKPKSQEPVIGPEQNLPEITLKAVVLSVILIVILSASNAYLGLKVGTTISASIPAVVISMGIFRLFRYHNVLEINIVQTAASVGEGITAGLAFTLPALVIMHYWSGFNYWEMVVIGVTGGILGVLFSIPLRRALLNDKTLRFPEGTAIGQVMRASTGSENSVKPIVYGGLAGGIIGLFQTGFRILAQSYEGWFIKGKVVFGCGMGFSPAVIAAGYICGFSVGLSMLIGVILGWVIGVPLLTHHYGIPWHMHDAGAIATHVWSQYIRYIGVGTMLIGGLWTLVTLFRPVAKAVLSSFEALHDIKQGLGHKILRTERDTPINIVIWLALLMGIVITAYLFYAVTPASLSLSFKWYLVIIAVCVIFLYVAGFIFSSISGYFAGLVGATNSPGSGLLVSALLILSLILLLIIEVTVHFNNHPREALAAAGLAVMICSFMGAALVMTNESIQDAKAGEIVGGTPWKQQLVLIVSVLIAAMVLPLILKLLFNAYGIGGVFPHAGMSTSEMLSAPQAALMAAVSQGVFNHALPWGMMVIGMIIGVIGIIIDESCKTLFENKRLLVLAVGLGIYLPAEVSVPVFIGGLIALLVQTKVHARYGVVGEHGDVHVSKGMHDALFLSCGMVAGSTLMGVILAIPFAIAKNSEVLCIMPKSLSGVAGVLSIIVTLGLCYWIYHLAVKEHPSDAVE